MKKNDELEIYIEDMGVGGEGIGKTAEGFPLFVKDAVMGDHAVVRVTKLKKKYGYARLISVTDPSPDRVEARCPYARPCGGCQIQELSYEKQLEFKFRKVKNNLRRIGGFSEALLDEILEPVEGMRHPFRYRNKAQFPFGTDSDGHIITGFYAGRSHRIIANRNCALGQPVNQRILNLIIDFMELHHIPAYDETTQKGLVRHVLIRCGYATNEIMVCLIINGDRVPFVGELAQALFEIPGMTSFSINSNKKNTNVILGDELHVIRGKSYITDQIGSITYQISPKAFFQVNPVQTEKLYAKALEYADLTGTETVWDLYCGIGTISLFLAQKAKEVHGVEIVPEAVEDAKQNARINGIRNADFQTGKAEDILPAYYLKERQEGRHAHADVIVVDPPRKGCEETLLHTMLAMQPKKIVYVSCDSATLARDLKILCSGGYELKKVKPVDMFPQTVSVETVVCLSNKFAKPKDYVEIGADAGK